MSLVTAGWLLFAFSVCAIAWGIWHTDLKARDRRFRELVEIVTTPQSDFWAPCDWVELVNEANQPFLRVEP